ncbi:hypothetical protein M0R45_006203 [Rubus argutus]|uniref:BRX domain-containing protein n=1 Tax=Rubus argutus TaxID=59490 RepID=A0AAW1YPY4_RUBAR
MGSLRGLGSAVSQRGEERIRARDGMLRAEVRQLRAEAISREQKCEIGNLKIQDCPHKIEEAWLVAREEAGRYRAAKQGREQYIPGVYITLVVLQSGQKGLKRLKKVQRQRSINMVGGK